MSAVAPSPTPPPLTARERLIVALDVPTASAALEMVTRLEQRVQWYKVGLELFCAAGPSIISTLHARGYSVFLDLKLHDIPNTVRGAIRSLGQTGAALLTVHAGGGEPMLRAAAEAASELASAPKLLAVTVLTSMDARQLEQTGVPASPAQQVLRLARLAQSAGISGLVCSPRECAGLRAQLGAEALLVVPGIRPPASSPDLAGAAPPDDQSRTSGPAEALAEGASMLVIGRPITHAADPARAVDLILESMRSVTGT